MKTETEVVKAEENENFVSFFVNPEDRVKVNLDVFFKNKKIISATKVGTLNLEEYKNLGHIVVWFDFSMPNYENISLYRQRCSVYNPNAKQSLIDNVQFRKFLIVWHLKDWSLTDSKNNKIELSFDEDGNLDDKSLANVYNTFPSLLDVALGYFEKEILF